jgi:hypothetical protein
MQVVNLNQKEYAQFKNRVNILSKKGIVLDHTVSGANKRVVKLTMHKEYDWNKLDEVCDEPR